MGLMASIYWLYPWCASTKTQARTEIPPESRPASTKARGASSCCRRQHKAKGSKKPGSYAAAQPGSWASWPLPLPLAPLLPLPSGAVLLPGAASAQDSGQWHTVRAARSGSRGRRCCSS